MTPEQKQRIEQIQKKREQQRNRPMLAVEGMAWDDVDFLLSLVKSQEASVGIADDLPYRIVEEMGLGLTFRSCTCGQLPCARLQPLRNALETIATSMRSACVEKVREKIADLSRTSIAAEQNAVELRTLHALHNELEALSIEKPSL